MATLRNRAVRSEAGSAWHGCQPCRHVGQLWQGYQRVAAEGSVKHSGGHAPGVDKFYSVGFVFRQFKQELAVDVAAEVYEIPVIAGAESRIVLPSGYAFYRGETG